MTTRKQPDPVDRLLDVAVYAPLGFLLSARELLPEWTERGRRQLAAQVPMARTVGEIAMRQGSKQARAALTRLRRQADEILEDMRVDQDRPPGPPAADTGDPEEADDDADADVVDDSDEAMVAAVARPGPRSTDLAIPRYDMLSASQVVQRLAGLSMEELDAVRSYVLAGRARKTVLLRVAQLRAPS